MCELVAIDIVVIFLKSVSNTTLNVYYCSPSDCNFCTFVYYFFPFLVLFTLQCSCNYSLNVKIAMRHSIGVNLFQTHEWHWLKVGVQGAESERKKKKALNACLLFNIPHLSGSLEVWIKTYSVKHNTYYRVLGKLYRLSRVERGLN